MSSRPDTSAVALSTGVSAEATDACSVSMDVEVAGVTIDDVQWWTSAFAAFGPPETRREALLASWQALVATAPCPEPFEPRTARAMGYPEWLTLHK